MAARWLVTVALFMVSNPADAARVEHSNQRVATSRAALAQLSQPRLGVLPVSVTLEDDEVLVATKRGIVRHTLSDGGASWLVPVGSHLVIGSADRSHDRADTLFAIQLGTGEIAWRRRQESLFAAELAGNLLVIERAGALDVVDARTGVTLSSTPIQGHSIQSVSRAFGRTGDLHVKTRGDLVAITPEGAVRWTRSSTANGNVARIGEAVVDGWVDRTSHRFGIVSYNAADGQRLRSIELGSTKGWYDFERLVVAPDGPDEVLVSAVFAVE